MRTVDLLRSLGHEVFERNPDFGFFFPAAAVRVIRGAADEARTLPHFERLDRRFRNWTRLAELTMPDSLVEWARGREAADAARVNGIFDECDVLMTPTGPEPPIEIGRWEGRGALWTINGNTPLVARLAPWNHTGQPAAAVPAGQTPSGLPLSVQLVGRPNDEPTLLSLAAQLEAETDWPASRPPVS